MHRIDGAGHVGNTFVAEDLAANRPPTEITAKWMNAVQEEIVSIIEAAGIPLDDMDSGQLLQALPLIFASLQALAKNDDATKGVALVAYNAALAYATGTLGASLRAHGRSVADFPYSAELMGLVDVSAKLQQVIDDVAASGGGIVRGPSEGILLINAPVHLKDNITLMFHGTRIKVGPAIKGNKGVFQNFTGTWDVPGTITASNNIKILGLTVDGQNAGIAGSTIANADMQGAVVCIGGWAAGSGADGIVVRDCDMANFAGAGVMAWKSSNVEIASNKFKNFFANTGLSSGAAIDCHEVTGLNITSNKIRHTAAGKSWHGIVVLDWDTGSKDVDVSGNIIRDLNGGDGISCEGNTADNLDNAVFTKNIIENCSGDGIGVDRCIEVTLNGNIVRNAGGFGVTLNNTEVAIITANNIRGAVGAGIWSNAATCKLIVKGNRIQEITYLGVSYQGDGIFINDVVPNDASAGHVIQGNYIKDVDGDGICSNTYGDALINGNRIYNAGRSGTATRRSGIRAADGAIVSGNRIVGLVTGGTDYGINSGGGNLPNLFGNKIAGTFSGGKYRVAYRAGIYCDSALNYENVEYDNATNVLSAYGAAIPALGRWFQGDIITNTAPTAGGTDRWRCVASGVSGTWKATAALSA